MLLNKCPHCDASHVQTAALFQHGFLPQDSDLTWVLVRCQNPKCNRLILVIQNKNGAIDSIYPASSFELDPTVRLAQEIRDDFKEAGLCLSSGCYKASMVMSRRVLQRCLKEQECTQYKLVDAIDYAIEQGVLRKSFHAVATEIREYGNLGAHPDDDQLSNVTKEKAQLIFNFARLLIQEFFEIPAVANDLRQAREGNNQP